MTSAVPPSEPRVSTAIMGRTYGYVRASTIEDVESPEDQAEIIAAHCARIGRRLDDVFSDDASSGGLPLPEREGGGGLVRELRKGDHLVVARADLMFHSFVDLSRSLGARAEQGVIVHLCDSPVGPLDPESAPARLAIGLLAVFSGSVRRRASTRCRQVSDSLKSQGRRNTRFAPYGSRWERRGRLTVMASEPAEESLCLRAAELRLAGYSWHQIRRYFAYEWKVRNRQGNPFGYTEIRELTFRGLDLMRAAGRLDVAPAIRPA